MPFDPYASNRDTALLLSTDVTPVGAGMLHFRARRRKHPLAPVDVNRRRGRRRSTSASVLWLQALGRRASRRRQPGRQKAPRPRPIPTSSTATTFATALPRPRLHRSRPDQNIRRVAETAKRWYAGLVVLTAFICVPGLAGVARNLFAGGVSSRSISIRHQVAEHAIQGPLREARRGESAITARSPYERPRRPSSGSTRSPRLSRRPPTG